VSTDVIGGDRSLTPLASVIEALERAVTRSELTPQQLKWSLARLGHRAERADETVPGGRRDEILVAAARVFLRRGYETATVEEVAREVSLTKAAIYHYFRSKEALLDAILDASLAAVEAAIAEEVRGPGPAVERLRAAMERCVDLVLDDEGTRVLLGNLDQVTNVASPETARRARRIRTLLERVLEAGQAEGVFATGDVAVTVFALIGAVNWLSTWYHPGGPRTPTQVRDVLVDQLLEGILAR